MLNFNYYGHACFQLDDGKYKLLFDPFLTGNPLASIKAGDVEADYVLVSLNARARPVFVFLKLPSSAAKI